MPLIYEWFKKYYFTLGTLLKHEIFVEYRDKSFKNTCFSGEGHWTIWLAGMFKVKFSCTPWLLLLSNLANHFDRSCLWENYLYLLFSSKLITERDTSFISFVLYLWYPFSIECLSLNVNHRKLNMTDLPKKGEICETDFAARIQKLFVLFVKITLIFSKSLTHCTQFNFLELLITVLFCYIWTILFYQSRVLKIPYKMLCGFLNNSEKPCKITISLKQAQFWAHYVTYFFC